MDELVNGCVGGWVDGYDWIGERVQVNGWPAVWFGQMSRWMDEWIGGTMDG